MSNPQSGVFVKFYMEAVEMKAESEKAGRPIYKEIPHIRIEYPGDRLNVFVSKAFDHFQKQYPQQWANFMAGQSEAIVGMPLTEWPQITKAQVKEAEFFNIRSVEQLSELSDAAIQKMGMGWQSLRKKAQDYLAAASGSAPLSSIQAENERLRSEIEAIKASLANPDVRKPGRPRKDEVEA